MNKKNKNQGIQSNQGNQISDNTPKLRFSEFTICNGWEVKKLGKNCRFLQGVQVDVELQRREPLKGYIRFLRIENYTQCSTDFRYIPKTLANNKTISKDDIVVVRYGATAGFIGRGFEGVLANNLFKVIPDQTLIMNEFIYEYLRSYRTFRYFQTEMFGGAMPAISFSIMNNLKFPFPSLPEQKKIASFLTSVDKKIQHLTRKKELLEQYKKGVMQKIFSREIRFPFDSAQGPTKSSFADRVVSGAEPRSQREVETSVNTYPDWEEKRLGEVCIRIQSGKSKTVEGGKYPLFGSTGIIGYCDNYSHEGKYILVARVGANAGTINYVDDSFAVTDNTLVVENQKDTEIKFIYYFLQRYNLNRLIFGSGQPLITGTQLKNLKILLPNISEQQKIVFFVDAIDNKILNIESVLSKTQKFKKGLLQQMFI